MSIFKKAAQLEEQNIDFAMVSIIRAEGSTPRNVGKMIVLPDGSIFGTIGGGLAERYAIDEALEAMKEKKSRVAYYKLNSDAKDGIKMNCGGNMDVYIEVHTPRPKIFLVGGGHVNYAVAKFANQMGYEVKVVDDREEFANPERFPFATEVYADPDYDKCIGEVKVDEFTCVVIATKDSDEKALRAVIDSNAKYIGVIGSKRKITIVKQNLLKDGYTEERLNQLYMPIGLDIGSETPEEIAISIIGEIMKDLSFTTGKSLKEML
ncbi:MAG: XdhC family protein [Firmicutes bacterium]|jgi:xanthine dehydrogenase accessory factor|nr:XdhC family protein [Bacillota bacterium]